MSDVRPFTIAVSDEDLADLKRRILATRWPEAECVDDLSLIHISEPTRLRLKSRMPSSAC